MDFCVLQALPEGACVQNAELSGEELKRAEASTREIIDRLNARQELLDKLSVATSNPNHVSELVMGDPMLASRVLKAVNSPFFGLSRKLSSVFRAVVHLGHNEVRNIVLQACVEETFSAPDDRTRQIITDLWAHSLACSRVAFALGRSLQYPEPDSIATMGLLHDIGKLIGTRIRPERAPELYSPLVFSKHSLLSEEGSMGIVHSILGGKTARTLGVPESACTAIAEHHSPSYHPPEDVPGDTRAIAILHVADLLCHLKARSFDAEDDDGAIYTPRPGWLEALGIKNGLEELCVENVLKELDRILPQHGAREEDEERETGDAPQDAALLH